MWQCVANALPSAIGVEARLSVVFAERELLPSHVRAFVDAVTRWGATALSGVRRAVLVPPARGRRSRRA